MYGKIMIANKRMVICKKSQLQAQELAEMHLENIRKLRRIY